MTEVRRQMTENRSKIKNLVTRYSPLVTDRKGFTLIEIAIVLVIIGIIIGAVLKGQDLIQNARDKKFINEVKAWEIILWGYQDRKGRFPGDSDKNGVIGEDGASDKVKTDLENAKFVNAPTTNEIKIGSVTLYTYIGNDGTTPPRNVIVFCASSDCTTNLPEEALKAAEALDTSIDGSSDAASGRVLALTAAPATLNANEWVVSGSTAFSYETGSPKEWVQATLPTYKAIVYRFDRP